MEKGFEYLSILPAGLHAQQGQLAALTLTAVLVGVFTHGCVQLKPAEMPGHVVLHLLGYQRISVLKLGFSSECICSPCTTLANAFEMQRQAGRKMRWVNNTPRLSTYPK